MVEVDSIWNMLDGADRNLRNEVLLTTNKEVVEGKRMMPDVTHEWLEAKEFYLEMENNHYTKGVQSIQNIFHGEVVSYQMPM